MNKEIVASLEDINIVVKHLISIISDNTIVLLNGDLASGKTTLVKEFLKEYGVEDDVTSPTFSIQNIYKDKFFHYDIYNKGYEEFISLGLFEELEKDGIHFIEWSSSELEELIESYGFKIVKIYIEKIDKKRRYNIYGT